MSSNYPDHLFEVLQKIKAENTAVITQVAALLKEALVQNHLLYIFGSGHSSILVEEAFHRAGGLIPVYPILYQFLTPQVSPKIAAKLERVEGIAGVLFERSQIKKGDVLWIVSQSGINSAAIEMALEAKKNGIKTIALTSLTHSKEVKSRHSSEKRLFELCDFVLDNHCPKGDALYSVGDSAVAATSSIANITIYNWVLTSVAELLHKEGKNLPIYKSTNTPGGDVHNEKLEAAYRSRIPLL